MEYIIIFALGFALGGYVLTHQDQVRELAVNAKNKLGEAIKRLTSKQ